MERLARSACS